MNGFLLPDEGAEPLEDGAHVTDSRLEVEDGVEVDALRDLRIGLDELPKVALLLPRAHRVSLDEPVRLVTREAGIDEREQEPMAEEKSVACVEVATHAVGIDDEALDDPAKAVEHEVEGEEGVGDDDPLRRGMRDVALVPERNVLQPDQRHGADDARQAADALGHLRVP